MITTSMEIVSHSCTEALAADMIVSGCSWTASGWTEDDGGASFRIFDCPSWRNYMWWGLGLLWVSEKEKEEEEGEEEKEKEKKKV